jgi:DNA mismatch repair protein MutL
MKSKIRILPQEVVVLIAAGEVIERPQAVVKELVENSLDAGATAITISLENGGLDMIRVTDNGSGIAPEDMLLAFAPHATSKLNRAEDLHMVGTLGFRGEALASIARVSKVTLTTRQKGADLGVKARNEGGQMLSVTEAAPAEGTQVAVKDLFFNAPVRRDFLDRPQRETALCAELVQQLILSRPDVSFRFTADKKQLYQSPGDGSLEGAMLAIYGVDTVKAMKPVDSFGQGLVVKGLVGVGEQARGNRGHQHFFLNGRAIRGQNLSRAVEEACRHRVMTGRFPICALNLTLPFEAVDVNVHPNKWEVRFAREPQVMAALSQAVADALAEEPLDRPPPLLSPGQQAGQVRVTRTEPARTAKPQPPVPEQREDASPPAAPRAYVLKDSALEEPPAPAAPKPAPPAGQQASQDGPILPGEKAKAAPAAPDIAPLPEEAQQIHGDSVPHSGEQLQVLGAAFYTYIIAQQGDRLLFIDQHALHERLLFDRLMAAASQGKAVIQALLSPEVFEVDMVTFQAFRENRQLLHSAGFEAEEFGDRAIRLSGVPMELGTPVAARAFLDALDEVREKGGLSHQAKREAIIMASCRHALKGGERLPLALLQQLVDEMIKSGVTPTCPHGRPLVLAMTRAELEKRFSRIQP